MNTEYRFGTEDNGKGERYIVRVKGDAEIELPIGCFQTRVEEYPDMSVTHDFKPDELIKRATDSEGNHYAWYFISDYHKTVDHVPAVNSEIAQINANIDYLSMMMDIDMMPMDDGMGEDMM